jgi:hypothetical protein
MSVIKVDKLDAAIRQLRTAITLWFNDGDPVAIHALAFAAYEVIHAVSKRRNPGRRDLIFDSRLIPEESRSAFNIALKKSAWFFKHADRDPDAEIEFDAELAESFILYAICGREQCGAPSSEEESTFLYFLEVHHPELAAKGREPLTDRMPIEHLERIRRLSKRQFFEGMAKTRRVTGRKMTAVLNLV